jgi:hypothetical protein
MFMHLWFKRFWCSSASQKRHYFVEGTWFADIISLLGNCHSILKSKTLAFSFLVRTVRTSESKNNFRQIRLLIRNTASQTRLHFFYGNMIVMLKVVCYCWGLIQFFFFINSAGFLHIYGQAQVSVSYSPALTRLLLQVTPGITMALAQIKHMLNSNFFFNIGGILWIKVMRSTAQIGIRIMTCLMVQPPGLWP